MAHPVYVIFGAAVTADGKPSPILQRRVETAWRAAMEDVQRPSAMSKAPPVFIASGAEGAHPPSEARVIRASLQALADAPPKIILDEAAYDTLDSIENCTRIIRALPDVGVVTVCTSPFHSLRCVMLFRMHGIRAKRAKAQSERQFLGWRRWSFYCVRECAATVWDVFLASIKRLRG